MAKPLRVLILEDNPDDALLLVRELQREYQPLVHRRVESAAELEAALPVERWDVVLSDFSMPGFSAPEALAIVRDRGPEVPFIIISGTVGEETAVAAIKAGADDFLLKSQTARLIAVIEREREVYATRAARRASERRLVESEDRYRRLTENAPDVIFRYRLADPPGFEYVNPAMSAVSGYTRDQFYADPGLLAALVHENDQAILAEVLAGETAGLIRLRWMNRDHTVVWTEQRVVVVRDGAGQIVALEVVARDVTERRRLEEELRQSQKMEAIGQLAGGVAHDFNNLLTVMNGRADLILARAGLDVATVRAVSEIREAGDRAAALTRQLLAFGRKQVLETRVLEMNGVVAETCGMLRRVIGEHIEVITVLAADTGRVKADPNQLSQVIINLVLNARDAMPRGGRLTIETSNADLDLTYTRTHVGASQGRHVALAISDTGCGMTEAVKARLFEPFFTTKEQGRGTGLGLATVYGIVKQSGGNIWAYSEVGRGTTFKVYLPRVDAAPASSENWDRPPFSAVGGDETILLVEDDEMVRALAQEILETVGYRMLVAHDGTEACAALGNTEAKVDLVLTDVVMPRLGGPALLERMRALRPDLRFLFMSGYTADVIVHDGVLDPGAHFIGKPFTPDALARKVREVLDTPAS
ncbi:MAG: response regulator [Planctomycetes bacterium]|nr:response regulator [Planctomycetota bacterium]